MNVKEFYEIMERDQEDLFEKLYGSNLAAKLCEKMDRPKPVMQEVETFRKVNWE